MNTPQSATQQQCSEQHQTPVSLLKKYWGYPAFLPHQEAIIASVLAGNDTLAIMATGGGKSLCYQLPPCTSAASPWSSRRSSRS